MEAQDGISVRPMRLKVLYTFDSENKTTCLARWPQLLDIQTAYLDENTQVGVIELKTCLQAIVSASPELIAKLGQDYTVYAYDYSEYETPLVGQGMLSWALASASSTPNAPAHQSKTMVTGRVIKNSVGLFSKGAQETLEVKLRLVPVPTTMQSEYLESIQRYREMSNLIPEDFDPQAWTSFIQQHPNLFSSGQSQRGAERTNSIDRSGIERFHQILSEGSTPREYSGMGHESPVHSPLAPPSRSTTPNGMQARPQPRGQTDASGRPSSRASVQKPEQLQQRPAPMVRRGSVQSGYGSDDEANEQLPPRKRARVFRVDAVGREDFNIERQPGSLRVAASTAASVRVHRPTPVSARKSTGNSGSLEEPVRPPTPIATRPNVEAPRRRVSSALRESSTNNYGSPYSYDDRPSEDPATSPEESRYQGIFESHFNMPSSPPIIDGKLPGQSSPALPPMPPMPDSGFMSASLEELIDEDGCIRNHGGDDAASPSDRRDNPVHGGRPTEQSMDGPAKETAQPSLPPQRISATSRPSSRGSVRHPPKLAPAPMPQRELERLASDPALPPSAQFPRQNTWSSAPMSDFLSGGTPVSQPPEEQPVRSGAGARRVRQVQARLDQCIREGQAPPYCENCGAIETPTWRRAWSKEIEGNEADAAECLKDPLMLFWEPLEKDENGQVTKFKLYKKSLVDADKEYALILLCNPCGLWLHKFKSMRPENKWHKQPKDKRKRTSQNRRGPLSGGNVPARPKPQGSVAAGSSPAHTDASSVAGEDGTTPNADNENENDDEPANKRQRANSVEPRPTSDTVQNRWDEQQAAEALRRAIQSSPAGKRETGTLDLSGNDLTSKPVRRSLFPQPSQEGPLKTLSESNLNSPRRCLRGGSQESEKNGTADDKENQTSTSKSQNSIDSLFDSTLDLPAMPGTPSPKRRSSLPLSSPNSQRSNRGGASTVSPSKRAGLLDDQALIMASPGKMGDLSLSNMDLNFFESWDAVLSQHSLLMPWDSNGDQNEQQQQLQEKQQGNPAENSSSNDADLFTSMFPDDEQNPGGGNTLSEQQLAGLGLETGNNDQNGNQVSS